MTITNPIISLDDVKSRLPIRPGNVEFDNDLLLYINVATQQIEDATRRRFTKQAHVEFFNSRKSFRDVVDLTSDERHGVIDFLDAGLVRAVDEQTLNLQSFPVDTAVAVKVFYDPDRAFLAASEVGDTLFTVDDETGRIFLRRSTIRLQKSIRVDYTAGFAGVLDADGNTTLSTTAPFDLKLACIVQTVFLFKKFDAENTSQRANTKRGGVPQNFLKASGLTPEAAQLLIKYQRILRGTT